MLKLEETREEKSELDLNSLIKKLILEKVVKGELSTDEMLKYIIVLKWLEEK